MHRPLLLAPLALAAALLPAALSPGDADAFSEDLCARGLRSGLRNCMTAKCDEGGKTAGCRANVVIDGGVTTLFRTGRSLYHTDITYLLAQAAGFDADAAYWISAYDQGADAGVYTPIDRCGDALPEELALKTVPLRGFNRSAIAAGGMIFHLPAPYRPEGETGPLPVDGLHPDLTDAVHEGVLFHVRSWAFGERALCVNGLTNPGPTYFSGDTCYTTAAPPEEQGAEGDAEGLPATRDAEGDEASASAKAEDTGESAAHKSANSSRKERLGAPGTIRYAVSTFSGIDADVDFTAATERQMADFDPTFFTPGGPKEVVMATDLAGWVAKGEGRMDGAPVPVELVRAGIYLHLLQDRLSHHLCGDASEMTGPDAEGQFSVQYDSKQCGQDLHALYHFQETGQAELPPQSEAAVRQTLAELKHFAKAWGPDHPDWMAKAGEPVDDEALVQRILAALRIQNAEARVDALTEATEALGFAPLPGFGDDRRCGIF